MMSLTKSLIRLRVGTGWVKGSVQCVRAWQQPVRRESTAKEPRSDEPKAKESGKKKGGSYTRVLAVLATSGIAGYALRSWQDEKKVGGNIARPGEFVKYALVGKEDVSSTCSIFTLNPASSTVVDTEGLLDRRALTSLQFKQPQIQVARNYTLLPPLDGQDPLELRFLIRKDGEVSNYIHRLPLSSEIEIRGPSVEYVMPEQVQSIVFLAGGTGIVPALQMAAKKDQSTRMEILWASRKREDCQGGVSDSKSDETARGWDLLSWWRSSTSGTVIAARASDSETNAVVSQLNGIKKGGNALVVDYYVDEEGTMIRPADVSHRLQSTSAAASGGRLLFVSGPEGFINYWAGPKQWAAGREVQGPLGGVLGSIDLKDWKVVKL